MNHAVRHGTDDDLQYPIHFFNDREHLFKTITMAGAARVDDICNTISFRRGWFWMRFSRSERAGYLRRRSFVERAMYDDYAREYGSLKERVPVFCYLVPNITEQKAAELARQRTGHGEAEPQVLMARLADMEDTTNVTFTLNDSHTAYWRTMKEAGLDFGGERSFPVVLLGAHHRAIRSTGRPHPIARHDARSSITGGTAGSQ